MFTFQCKLRLEPTWSPLRAVQSVHQTAADERKMQIMIMLIMPLCCVYREGGPCDSHATFSGGASFSEERVFRPFPLSRVRLLLDCRSKSCMRKSVVTLEHVPALCHVFYFNPLSFVTDVTKVLKRLKI